MYSMHHLEVPSTKAAMERMYSTTGTLKTEDSLPHAQNPTKKNMFQSMFSAFNVIWEHFSKVPSNFMTNINNPLSVTVVQNEGIISHEFFKSLTTRKEPLTTDNIYIHNVPKKEALNIVEKLHCSMFDEKNSCCTGSVDKSMTKNFMYDSMHLDMKDYEIIERFEKLELSDGIDTVDYIMEKNELKPRKRTACNFLVPYCNRENQTNDSSNKVDTTECTENCADVQRNMIPEEKRPSASIEPDTEKLNTDASRSEQSLTGLPQSVIPDLFIHMWRKVVNKVSNQINLRTNSMEPDAIARRTFSPKQRRKLAAVAKGRGRGRAKPQLGRSRVSQTRHKKERTKHNLVIDIQDDFESWQDFEIYHTVQHESIDWSNFEESDADVTEDTELFIEEVTKPITLIFNDVKPRCQRPKTKKVADQETSKFSARVRYVPDSICEINTIHEEYKQEKCDPQTDAFRSRLFSESSVDSEDSYCIVFESGSDVNCKGDVDEDSSEEYQSSEDGDEREDEQEGEEEEDESESEIEPSAAKVRFNLTPKVHVMVQWDYAYRAARRGPWEQMARDRDRFKGRINSIERVLHPILSTQHRTRIWQERFAT